MYFKERHAAGRCVAVNNRLLSSVIDVFKPGASKEFTTVQRAAYNKLCVWGKQIRAEYTLRNSAIASRSGANASSSEVNSAPTSGMLPAVMSNIAALASKVETLQEVVVETNERQLELQSDLADAVSKFNGAIYLGNYSWIEHKFTK